MALPGEHNDNDLPGQVVAEARRRSLVHYLLDEPLVLGVSGGADSLVMLHLLCAIRGDKAADTLHVAHLNHWFRGKEAREDADYVQDIAGKWGIGCTVETFDVPNYARRLKLSTEDAARRVRYAFLASIARERHAAVAVAHNADDQVETVLMSILRGTGVGGLAGMQMLSAVPEPPGGDLPPAFAQARDAGKVPLFRPLLHVWRHTIVAYCQQQGLEPRFDATNWERIYRRNRVRHDLIPYLQLQYSLAVKDHLYNLAEIAQAENNFLDSVVEREWEQVARVASDGTEVRFDILTFEKLPEAMRRRLARRAIAALAGTLQDITFEHIQAVVAILRAAPGSPAAMHLPHGLVARREGEWASVGERDDRRLTTDDRPPTTEEEAVSSAAKGRRTKDEGRPCLGSGGRSSVVRRPEDEIPVEPGTQLSLYDGWLFDAELLEPGVTPGAPSELVAIFDYEALAALGSLALRARLPGDHMRPLGMQGSKSLQDLMVDAKIPRELRDRIPVVALQGTHEVLWVPGRDGRRSHHAPVTEATVRVLQLEFYRK
jgi:tRNA(Ile)-lysidine synthase